MDRFGSSKLRIGWALVCLFVTGLVLMAIRGQQGDGGSQILIFGTAVPWAPTRCAPTRWATCRG
jgi:hypothetical protein